MMKSNFKKKRLWLGGMLTTLLAIVLMAGCTSAPAASNNLYETNDNQEERYAGAEEVPGDTAGTTDTGRQAADDDFRVARVNGVYVYASDVSFLVAQAQEMLFWEYFEMFNDFEIDFEREFRDGLTFERVLREETVRLAAFNIITDDYARQRGVTLTTDNIETVDSIIDDFIEQFGEEELEELLWADGIRGTEHLREIYYSQMRLESVVGLIMEDPSEFAQFEQYMPPEEEDIAAELLGAKHILITFDSFDSEEEAEDFANDLLARALAGEDFSMLIAEYGEDPGMATFVNGYSFAAGDMVPEFEQATRELEIGGISGLVTSQFGIHIIMRTEPNMNDWHMLRGTQPRTLEDRMMEAIFLGFQAMVGDADIEFFPALNDVPLWDD